MACFYPRPAHRVFTAEGRKVRYGHPPARTYVESGPVPFVQDMLVPCGKCVGCNIAASRAWAIRCQLESSEHLFSCWCTLTYDDAHVPTTLRRDHLSGFLKRFRQAVREEDILLGKPKSEYRKVRFFGCGEYGEKRGRPHYHVILFGVRNIRHILQDTWKFGFSEEHELRPEAISYVAGYCAKKVGELGKPRYGDQRLPYDYSASPSAQFVDEGTGEVYRREIVYQPPFLQMSLRPGIGGSARRFWRSWRSNAVFAGKEVPVPRFLHESWKANVSVSEVESLRDERLALARFKSRQELDAGEANALARLNLQREARNL